MKRENMYYNSCIIGGCLLWKDEAASLACLDTCKELGNELCNYDGKLGNASNLLAFLKGYEKLTCLLGDWLGYARYGRCTSLRIKEKS